MLLDEPSDGVQPSIVDEIGDFLLDLNRTRAMTILIVEQNVELMRRVAHRAHVLEKGQIVATLGGKEIRDGEALAGHLAL